MLAVESRICPGGGEVQLVAAQARKLDARGYGVRMTANRLHLALLTFSSDACELRGVPHTSVWRSGARCSVRIERKIG